jgi:hypothetical protein
MFHSLTALAVSQNLEHILQKQTEETGVEKIDCLLELSFDWKTNQNCD